MENNKWTHSYEFNIVEHYTIVISFLTVTVFSSFDLVVLLSIDVFGALVVWRKVRNDKSSFVTMLLCGSRKSWYSLARYGQGDELSFVC